MHWNVSAWCVCEIQNSMVLGVIELKRSIRSLLYFFFPSTSLRFPSFYDSGWFTVNESLLNVLTLIFDWYPFLYLPCHCPRPYGMDFFLLLLLSASLFAWFRFLFFSLLGYFYFLCVLYGDLSLFSHSHSGPAWWTHTLFLYRVEFVVSINWIIWFSKRQRRYLEWVKCELLEALKKKGWQGFAGNDFWPTCL